MFKAPVVVAVAGTLALVAIIAWVEVREYLSRLRNKRLQELHRRK